MDQKIQKEKWYGTKMKRNDILSKIEQIIEEIDIGTYRIILNYDYNVGNGYCDNYYDSDKEIHIGVKELKSFFNKEISNELFVKLIVNLYHETQHYYQQIAFFENNQQKDESLFYNYLACIGNGQGYYNPEINPYNYYNNIRELDAEYTGIKKAYNFLTTIFSEKEADQLIVNYFNNRLTQNYYISSDKPVSSMAEINMLFTKTIMINQHKIRQYNVNYINEDKPIQYIQEQDEDFILNVNDLLDGALQDEILAGAFVKYLEDKEIKSDLRFAQIYNNAKEKLLSSIQKFTQYPKQRDEIDINLDEIL